MKQFTPEIKRDDENQPPNFTIPQFNQAIQKTFS